MKKDQKERDPKRSGRRRRIIVELCCLLVFCFSVYMIASQLVREKRSAEAFEDLRAQISQVEETYAPADKLVVPEQVAQPEMPRPDQDTQPVETPPPEFHKYDALYEQNNDMFGWVKIDGTELDYPVMYTPDDPERYLRIGFDGKKSAFGVPFMDGACYPECGNYIVYGHHMKNGTMFAMLPDYADEEFWKEHPVIHFDLVNKQGDYEVLAAFYAKVYRRDDEDVFRYYDYTDLTDEAVFDEYLSQVRQAALYDTGVTAEYGDQLLTLSTCNYHTSNGRFVVVAREIT